MDCLGIFNYLLVSETRCIVATWLPSPDGSRECTVDEKQKPREDPQPSLRLGWKLLRLEPEEGMRGRVGLSVPAGHSAEMITVEQPFPKQRMPPTPTTGSFPQDLCEQKDGAGMWGEVGVRRGAGGGSME